MISDVPSVTIAFNTFCIFKVTMYRVDSVEKVKQKVFPQTLVLCAEGISTPGKLSQVPPQRY